MDYLLLLLDSPEQADGIRELLETYGCPMIVVCNLQDGITALSAREPKIKLVLVNSAAPIKALSTIREADASIPILVLSHLPHIPAGMGRVAVLPKAYYGHKEKMHGAIKALLE